MRFWQKIFLLTLLTLLISLNIFSYLFIKNNTDSALEKEIRVRLNDYKAVRISFQTNLIYKKYLLDTAVLSEEEIVSAFEDFSSSYPAKLEMKKTIEPNQLDAATVALLNVNDSNLMTVSSVLKIDDNFFRLTSSTDISELYENANAQIIFSRKLSLALSLTTAIITLIVSLALTRRINALRRSTRKMSHGIFFMRAKINSHDEIGGLAEDFNIMADTVESKVMELSQIADDRKRFIDNIAHEMKTPLTSIIGFADLLRTAKLDNQTKVEYAENIYKEGKHLKNVSSKLMELILLGKTNPTKQSLDSGLLLDEVFQSMEQICINAQVVLVLQKHTEPHAINVDIELIKSLLYNLIDNACKASKPGSRIVLSSGFISLQDFEADTPQQTSLFYMSVRDFGKGIPAEEITKITEPFYMLDKARTREHGGAGLGLALCCEIAALHNAELKIESVLGEGTEIKIIFKNSENSRKEVTDENP